MTNWFNRRKKYSEDEYIEVPVESFDEIQTLVIHAIMEEGAYAERERILELLDGVWTEYEAQGNVEAIEIINQLITLLEGDSNGE